MRVTRMKRKERVLVPSMTLILNQYKKRTYRFLVIRIHETIYQYMIMVSDDVRTTSDRNQLRREVTRWSQAFILLFGEKEVGTIELVYGATI